MRRGLFSNSVIAINISGPSQDGYACLAAGESRQVHSVLGSDGNRMGQSLSSHAGFAHAGCLHQFTDRREMLLLFNQRPAESGCHVILSEFLREGNE